MTRQLRFASLNDAVPELAALAQAPAARPAGAWTVSQILNHCAASIEYSITGYPKNKPALVRAIIGPLVLGKFLRQGYMSHDRNAEIPGAVTSAPDGDVPSAMQRLRKAIEDFKASQAQLAPHFVYGRMTKSNYDRVHAMHLADHLSGIDY